MQACGIIPVRLNSSRFPNKIFHDLGGKSIIDRSVENALQYNFLDRLLVATDSKEVQNYISDNYNIEVFYSEEQVSCGSERAYLVYEKYKQYDYYITFPVDECLLNPISVNQVWIDFLNIERKNLIYTCYSDFYHEWRVSSPRSCKIVSIQNHDGEKALYFSRSVIPLRKGGYDPEYFYKKHVGIFIFSHDLFKIYGNYPWKQSPLSDYEGLEQLKFIENGFQVYLIKMDHQYFGIDDPEDIRKLEEKSEIFSRLS